MAGTAFDFLLQDFGNWNPGAQTLETPTDLAQASAPDWSSSPFAPPTNDVDQGTVDYWGDEGGAASQNWGAVMIPLMQLMSNNEQFATEFNEAQSRFWNQNEWSQNRDQFNMDLSARQQSSQEQQALWGQQNWGQQFGETQMNNQVSRDVAQGDLALAQEAQAAQAEQWAQSFMAQGVNDEHARILADQRLQWDQTYGQQSLDNQREAARYATFGRGAGPARWSASWG